MLAAVRMTAATPLPWLDAFARVFPEASFVLAHRDPYRALLSASTMLEHINQPFAEGGVRLRREDGAWLARMQRLVPRVYLSELASLAQRPRPARVPPSS